jgi:uncharacterized protein
VIETAPVVRERIDVLDGVRGVAVLGILFVNIESLTGYSFLTAEQRAALAFSQWDGLAGWFVGVFVEYKFYALFSLLFGIGFSVFVRRAMEKGADAKRLFKRRLVGLLLIGLVHTVLIWFGDILVTYALLGFVLVPFLRKDDRSVLRWAVAMFVVPLALYVAGAAVVAISGAQPPERGGPLPPVLADAAAAFANGNYLEVVKGNVVFTLANIARRIALMFFPRMFGMFLIGLWIGRHLLDDLGSHGPLLRRVVRWGFGVGLPLAIVGHWVDGAEHLPAPLLIALDGVTKSIAVPALALGYAAGLTLMFRRAPGLLRAIAPVGRMALTNYLLHSVAGIVVFYGLGFGTFARLSLLSALAVAVTFFLVQIVTSRAWLSHFAFGPAEWLWRSFTYQQRFDLKRA